MYLIIADIASNQKILSSSDFFPLKICSFYHFQSDTRFFTITCPFIAIITAKFTLFIPAWITNSSSDLSTHPTLHYTFVRQCVELYRRAITDATRWSRANRATWRYQSSSEISWNACSYIDIDEMESPSSRRAHMRIHIHNVARQKLFTPRAPRLRQVPRRVKRVRVKYDGVWGHPRYFFLLALSSPP